MTYDLAAFSKQLSEFHLRSGGPSTAELEKRTGLPGSTINDKLRGRSKPRWEHVQRILSALGQFATENGDELDPELADTETWRQRWMEMQGVSPDSGARGQQRGSREPDADDRRDNTDEIRATDRLADSLSNFHSNPEGIYYIGQLILEAEVFLRRRGLLDAPSAVAIDEVVSAIDHDTRRDEGLFDPVVPIAPVRQLIGRLLEYRDELVHQGSAAGSPGPVG
jgi:transcriptional regulator with XRE-family HTH domain